MAGFETSSGVVMFALLELARNTEAQTRLREKLLATELDWKTTENLPYLDAVSRESLRFHPSSAETHRIAICDDTIPLRRPVTLQTGETITALPVRAGDEYFSSPDLSAVREKGLSMVQGEMYFRRDNK
ncbi:cytochrome P450 [Armillaria borealis]|uniref:Cytochrome P450 n=1 Tax=Armillaria borealis TaxID=47425 RepID=A0AA39JHV8_9AGAR|nr:cytochrome P450 [Armillaria borealis]